MWTKFEYCYRDGGNYKAFGCIFLEGPLSASQQAGIIAILDGGEFFIAEQVGIPSLYEELYRWSNGRRTGDDHCWHEFVRLTEHIALPEGVTTECSSREFAERFAAIEQWNEALSPHFQRCACH